MPRIYLNLSLQGTELEEGNAEFSCLEIIPDCAFQAENKGNSEEGKPNAFSIFTKLT